MKLCIPVREPNGLESLIEPHLPDAEHLLFFDTETRQFEQVALREQQAGAGENIAMDVVMCGSINRMTLQTLTDQGIKVYGTEAQIVAQAIAQYEEAEQDVSDEKAGGCGGCCSGGQHHDSSEHSCQGKGGGCGGHDHARDHEKGGCGSHGRDSEAHHRHGSRGSCGNHSHDGGGGCCGTKAHQQCESVSKQRGENFRIAVCSQNRKTVTDHAGKCRKFWIYEVRQGQVFGKSLLELPIEQSMHETPAGQAHPLDDMDVLITQGIGSGMQQRLERNQTQTIVTMETDPDRAVALFLAEGV